MIRCLRWRALPEFTVTIHQDIRGSTRIGRRSNESTAPKDFPNNCHGVETACVGATVRVGRAPDRAKNNAPEILNTLTGLSDPFLGENSWLRHSRRETVWWVRPLAGGPAVAE